MTWPEGFEAESVLDCVPNIVCLLDAGRIVYANRLAVTTLGVEAADSIVGRSIADFATPLYKDVVTALLVGAFAKGEEVPVKLQTADGVPFDAKLAAVPLAGSSGLLCLIGRDISTLIHYGSGLLKSKRRLHDLIEASQNLQVVCLWPEIEFVNSAGIRLLGGESAQAICGTKITDYIHANYRILFEEGIEALLEEDEVLPMMLVNGVGEELDVQMSFSRVGWSEPPEILVEARDITAHNKAVVALKEMIENLEDLVDARTTELRRENAERRKAEQLVRYQATYDALTSLPNRSLFFQTLPDVVRAMEAQGEMMALMFIDLDGFKDVNDLLGHDAGDLLLVETGKRLVAGVRPHDTVARLGGDEFTVILPKVQGADDAARVVRRVLEMLKTPYNLDGREAQISGSIGIALYPNDAEDVDGLVKAADTAMFLAKDRGKATYQFFTSELREQEIETQAMSLALEQALEDGEFLLCYLPKVSLTDGRVTGLEALLRWKSASMEAVRPDRFIPLLEERGLISEVGDWVLRTAARQWQEWSCRYGNDLKIAINISARQLRARGFVKHFCSILDSEGLPYEALELEVTETSVLTQRSRATQVLHDLAKQGVPLTLDDFGTGYASLRYLQSMPVNSVKIDRTFIDNMLDDEEDRAIVKGIIFMAHAFNRKVVAVGLETEAQRDMLRELKCDEAQGFLICQPLAVDDVDAFLAAQAAGADAAE